MASPPHKLPPRLRPPARTDPSGSEPFPRRLFDRPNAVFVYGPSRPLVNLVLFALAKNTNPEFQWVEIAPTEEERAPCDPVRLGWIPKDRLWLIDRAESLRLKDPGADLPLSAMIRSDESPEVLARVTGFLALPDTSQQILTAPPPDDRPGVVAVTNAHRVSETIPKNRVPSLLNVHLSSGFSLLVGYSQPAGAGRDLFDFVFRLQGKDENHQDWRRNQLVCEKGISSGPFRELRPIRLEEIPLIADIVSRARPLPWKGESS